MSITSGKGDQGSTKDYFGNPALKTDPVIELSGSIDEAVSYLGIAKSLSSDKFHDSISQLQQDLMKIPLLDDVYLSKRIDELSVFIHSNETPLTGFLIPGDDPPSSHLFYARALVRKAERAYLVYCGNKSDSTLIFLNRASDYLFVLCQLMASGK